MKLPTTDNSVSISQRPGVICLIPKDVSCVIELSNWRPLTLLNVYYKILANVIGQRIETILSSLIHSDQTGFIKGRFIGQNVRLLNDIMEYTEAKKLPCILLSIDFRKCTELYNFGPKIRKCISILYQSVRQRCPLSPLLFVLAVELLARPQNTPRSILPGY